MSRKQSGTGLVCLDQFLEILLLEILRRGEYLNIFLLMHNI